jgi:hypothetical protein
VVAGKPNDSHLLTLIIPGPNGEAEMPQKRPALHPVQIDLVRRWIAEGATDDTPADAGRRYSAENPPVYGAPPTVTSLDWSPDGRWIAVAGHSEILLHRADGTGEPVRLIGLSERVESVAFSPDGTAVGGGGGDTRPPRRDPSVEGVRPEPGAVARGDLRHAVRGELVARREAPGLRLR